jgi:hypothetical protein
MDRSQRFEKMMMMMTVDKDIYRVFTLYRIPVFFWVFINLKAVIHARYNLQNIDAFGLAPISHKIQAPTI